MKKFENFCKAVKNLEEGSKISEPLSLIEQTGMIKLFEICFEQTWKVLKEILEMQGLNPNNFATPKKIFSLSYSAGILPEEEVWIEILEDRNILSHVYDADKVQDTIEKIKKKYLPAFQNLQKILQEDWLI